MPRVTVRIPGLLARFTDGEWSVSTRADTVGTCLDRLIEAHPELEPHLFDGNGRIREHLLLFAEDRRIAWPDDASLELDEGSTVTILQAVSGG